MLLAQTLGRRFRRVLGHDDIAFWMVSQHPAAMAIALERYIRRGMLIGAVKG